MKRNYTFELKRVFPDYNIKLPKDLEKRIDKYFKLIGDIKVGGKLEMHFEDGFIFKTAPLDLQGYIKKTDDDDKEVFVTLCTKDMAFEMDVVDKKLNIKLNEQLTLL